MKRKLSKGMVVWAVIIAVLCCSSGVLSGLVVEGVVNNPFRTLRSNPGINTEGTPPPLDADQPEGPPVTPPISIGTGNSITIDGKDYTFKKGIVNILCLGVDVGDTGQEVRTEQGNGYNSDAMVLVVVDMNAKTIKMVNLPRDTYAEIPLMDDYGNITGRKMGKLNSAYSQGRGKEKYSYANAVRAVSTLFYDIEIPYYVGIDMGTVGALATAVGGVPMNLDINMARFGWRRGQDVTLKGHSALEYIRLRKGVGMDGSDISRVKRQMRFIRAFAKQAQSLGLTKLVTDVLPTINKTLDYNMGLTEMLQMARVAQGVDFDNSPMVMLEGAPTNDGNYWKPNQDHITQLFIDLWLDPA